MGGGAFFWWRKMVALGELELHVAIFTMIQLGIDNWENKILI